MSLSLQLLSQISAVIFFLVGCTVLWSTWTKKLFIRRMGLFALTLLGPITLGLCWKAQLGLMTTNTIMFSKLMAGTASTLWAFGNLGLIIGSSLALGALSIGERSRTLILSVISVASIWIVIYLHPTPHYVPMPEWADNLVWFFIIVGGGSAAYVIHLKWQPYFKLLQVPISIVSGLVSLVSIATIASFLVASSPIDLTQLSPKERIEVLGCLVCHSMGDVGYPEPGGGLESVASRPEDVLSAFLLKPDADTAKKLGIRTEPVGAMAGVQLSQEEVVLLVESFKELFSIQPPTEFGPGWDHIGDILSSKTCLACHSLKGQGAPGGGLGKPLEDAAIREEEVLLKWLMNPSPDNAKELGVREAPLGAMMPFALDEESAKEMAKWLRTLNTNN